LQTSENEPVHENRLVSFCMEAQVKVIGLIGGMSAESSREYYRAINELVAKRLGGSHNARSVLYTVDFDPIAALQAAGDWSELDRQMIDATRKLEAAGAQCVLICANTMHKCAPAVEAHASIPLIHIADSAGESIRRDGFTRVGLLGTRFTMEGDFYSGRLRDRFAIETLIPDETERVAAHQIIYDELVHGTIHDESRSTYRNIIANFVSRGAQAIVLGCTELMLLLRPEDSAVPMYDTMSLHAAAAVDFSLHG
jgi:aspartate racemase